MYWPFSGDWPWLKSCLTWFWHSILCSITEHETLKIFYIDHIRTLQKDFCHNQYTLNASIFSLIYDVGHWKSKYLGTAFKSCLGCLWWRRKRSTQCDVSFLFLILKGSIKFKFPFRELFFQPSKMALVLGHGSEWEWDLSKVSFLQKIFHVLEQGT